MTPDVVTQARPCWRCRNFDGPPLTCRCLGVPIPWLEAIAPTGPCPDPAPRWVAR